MAEIQASQSVLRPKVLIDTDIGDDIDDALALALAVCSPEIELVGVTTVFGDTQRRARLAAHLLRVFGREDIPVAMGSGIPLQPRQRPSLVHQAGELDALTAQPPLSPLLGAEFIAQMAQTYRGKLTLLCIGPLTNVARAFVANPQLFLAVKRIVLMGGTSGLPFPEWNIRSDARAAQIVLGAGVPVTMIGWNITTRCRLHEHDIELLAGLATPQARLLSELITIWRAHRPWWHPAQPFLHDPLAVAALCRPELLRFAEMPVRVLAEGPLSGFMVAHFNGPLVSAAVDVQADKVRAWVMEKIL